MDRNNLRKRLLDYKKREERPISWIARQTGINQGSLQNFWANVRKKLKKISIFNGG